MSLGVHSNAIGADKLQQHAVANLKINYILQYHRRGVGYCVIAGGGCLSEKLNNIIKNYG
jgi:hypothetical protein